jgi:hypothetical protein
MTHGGNMKLKRQMCVSHLVSLLDRHHPVITVEIRRLFRRRKPTHFVNSNL